MNFNFILLGLAALSVICAPLIAMEDIEKSQLEIEKSRPAIQKLIDSEEEKLEEIENQIAKLQVSSDQRDESEEKLLKTREQRIAKSLNDLKKKQRESILGIYSSDFPIVLFQIDFLRIGLLTVLILMSQHMIKLARYNFRLMTFYRARQDVLLMTTTDALPWSELTTANLEQAANALSPDHVDPEISSKTLIEMLRHPASWRIKQTPGQ